MMALVYRVHFPYGSTMEFLGISENPLRGIEKSLGQVRIWATAVTTRPFVSCTENVPSYFVSNLRWS